VDAKRLSRAYAITGGVLVATVAMFLTEYTSGANQMHSPLFYQVASGVLPLLLAVFARSGRLRFPATAAAAVYMGVILVMMWYLQLVPGRPMVAPIYNPVTHMVPPHFPLLLVVPAFAIDMLLHKRGQWNDWTLAVLAGTAFVGLLLGVQWFFSNFLLSPSARDFFFAADQWSYMVEPGAWQHHFWGVPTDAAGHLNVPAMARGLSIAALLGIASTRIGIWCGNGMARLSASRRSLSRPLSSGRHPG
jgi:hypothetical protein